MNNRNIGKVFRFNYNGENYVYYSENKLYTDFLFGFEYSNISIDNAYIYIDFENGNELKIKLL